MEILENKVIKIIVSPDNIIEIIPQENWSQPDSVEMAIASANLVKKAVDGKRRATMVYIPSLYVDKKIISAYTDIDTGEIAIALIVESFGAKLLGNIVLKFIRKEIPTKIFDNKEAARIWLRSLLMKE